MSSISIRTARLLLLPFRPEDAEALFQLWNDPDVRQFLWDDQPVPLEGVVEQIALSRSSFEQRGFGMFSLAELRQPEVLIGFVGLRTFGPENEIELLYGLTPLYWGRGYASEASWAVLRHGFETLGLEEIYAGADLPNAAAFQVMERLGMDFVRDRLIGDLPVRYHRLRREEFQAPAGTYEILPAGD